MRGRCVKEFRINHRRVLPEFARKKTHFLSHLLTLKKFRKRGNKDGALQAFFKLEEDGLGKVVQVGGGKGAQGVSSFFFFLRMS